MKRLMLVVFALVAVSLSTYAGGQGEAKKGTIDFWHHESPTHRVAAFQQVIDAYQKENPNITVQQHVVAWDDSITKLTAALAAGNPPDFTFSYVTHTINLYRTGSLMAVDDLVAAIDKQYTYLPGQADQFRYQGHYWGAPVFTMMYALSYRPSFFQKYVGTAAPPKTWDELIDYAKKCTVDTPEGKIYGIGLGAAKNLFGAQQFYTFVINTGGSVYDENGNVAFNTPEVVKALAYYKELLKYAPPGTTSWSWGEQELAFASGKVAMMLGNGIPDARRFAEANNNDLAASEQPYLIDGKRGGISFVNDVAIFKKTQDRGNYDNVKKFVMFAMKPEMNEILCNMEPFSFLPVTKATVDYAGYWSNPMIKMFAASGRSILDSLQYGKLWGTEHGGWTNLGIGAVDASGVLAEVAQKVAVGEMSPAEAAAWGQTQIEKLTPKL